MDAKSRLVNKTATRAFALAQGRQSPLPGNQPLPAPRVASASGVNSRGNRYGVPTGGQKGPTMTTATNALNGQRHAKQRQQGGQLQKAREQRAMLGTQAERRS